MTANVTAEEIELFLNQVRLLAENQREILLGPAPNKLTNTQGHVLMLIAQNGPQTNTELANRLQVSPAAMTKALRVLANGETPMVSNLPDEHDKRTSRWSLTTVGLTAASAHSQSHKATVAAYEELVAKYSPTEQATIMRFLQDLQATIFGGTGNA
jgi:DNA-binding MarR family transcriptional regulator